MSSKHDVQHIDFYPLWLFKYDISVFMLQLEFISTVPFTPTMSKITHVKALVA